MVEHPKAAWFRGRALEAIRLALGATDPRIKRLHAAEAGALVAAGTAKAARGVAGHRTDRCRMTDPANMRPGRSQGADEGRGAADRHQHRAARMRRVSASTLKTDGTGQFTPAGCASHAYRDRCNCKQRWVLPYSYHEWADFYGRRPLAFRPCSAALLGGVRYRGSEQSPRRVCGPTAYRAVDVRSPHHRSLGTKPSPTVTMPCFETEQDAAAGTGPDEG